MSCENNCNCGFSGLFIILFFVMFMDTCNIRDDVREIRKISDPCYITLFEAFQYWVGVSGDEVKRRREKCD